MIRLEIPPNFPSEAAQQMQQHAAALQRELLKQLGYPVAQRIRISRWTKYAKQLMAGKKRLTEQESLEVIDELHPQHDDSEDKQLLKLSRARKCKVRQRLVKPYEPKP